MSNCEWCNLSDEDRKYLLFDDEYWAAYLADEQDYIGRCILVLKRHAGTLSELSGEEWTDLQLIIRRIEGCLKIALGADLCNWTCLLNNFYKDDDPNPHVHLHCRPRYSKPVVIGDNTYTDEEFAHHYALKKCSRVSDDDRQIIYRKMKEYLFSIL
ncbi:HIT family protein [Butyrivibrio sp. FCS014]|uniref:HIT family protein n=1 Tax=Butyrivibrio sp. FCS014 TaxID=1408304 RepID=UPI0004663FF0|nr:HIT family protein [Butyrivibrio sp. FCS014]